MSELRAIRIGLGLSQKDVAVKIGVTQSAVTKWETGMCTPSAKNLMQLAKLFGCTIDALMGSTPSR